MKNKYFIIITLILSSLMANAQNEHYYYYKGEKLYLQIDYSRISVISDSKISINADKILNLPFNTKEEKSFTKQNVILVDKSSNLHNKDTYITEIKFPKTIEETEYSDIIRSFAKDDCTIKVLPTYIIRNQELGISNNFYVKLYREEDKSKLFDLAEKYSIQVLGYNEFMPLWYTLSCVKETVISPIEAANMFYETKLFESSEPEFLYHNLLASNDTYFSDQWGLKNTGQYGGTTGIDIKTEQAWLITTGSPNIRVAVFDHGFEMNHPDLQLNVYGTGYDATTNTTPAQVRGSHGTACAGIIGAQQNNAQGISGIAPNSKLMSISINLLLFSDTPQQLANGFNWAWQNGADVISNSWGGYTPSTIIDDAIINTLTQGRNGKGTIVVFAAGNENDTNIRYPGNSNPDILIVGAISPCGERKSPTSCDTESWGSCYGIELDVVAPGVLISTTDRQGNNGYNYDTKTKTDYSNRDYTEWFNGTSSACPHVAGVTALILSINPTLTGQQVRNIIESTAQKVGGYTYQTTSGRPNGTWDNEMGYGLVDAYAAVQAACATTTYNYTNQIVTTNTTITNCGDINVQNVNVTNNAKLTLDAAGTTTIESDFEVELGSELEIK